MEVEKRDGYDERNILKYKAEINDQRERYQEEIRGLKKKQSELRNQLESRTGDRNRL